MNVQHIKSNHHFMYEEIVKVDEYVVESLIAFNLSCDGFEIIAFMRLQGCKTMIQITNNIIKVNRVYTPEEDMKLLAKSIALVCAPKMLSKLLQHQEIENNLVKIKEAGLIKARNEYEYEFMIKEINATSKALQKGDMQ